MIKLIGFVLIVGASTSFGFLLSSNLKSRLSNLKELQFIIFKLESCITYTYTPLGEACEIAVKNKETNLSKVFRNISEELKDNKVDSAYDAFINSIEIYKNTVNLEEEEIDILKDFFKNIGTSDMDNNKKIFHMTNERLSEKIKEADVKLKKNSKMYKYLGFSFGAVIAILLL